MAAIYDPANRAYAEDYVTAFRSRFEELGGRLTAVETFPAGREVPFEALARRLAASGGEGVLLAAGALDAAVLCQRLRRAAPRLRIFSSGWALTQEFIENSGRSGEGVVFAEFFDRDSQEAAYVRFKERFQDRFGVEPNFAALFGYETARVLLDALSRNPDPRALKETILRQKSFSGLQGKFEIDAFGDARRRFLLITVSGGRFQTLE
jgi:branched-chain amino acid transport system substrate-binding protein